MAQVRFTLIGGFLGAGKTPPVLSLSSGVETQRADVIVNARVAIDPEILQREVEAAVRAAGHSVKATAMFLQTQSFRPGRPNPTYRYADAV